MADKSFGVKDINLIGASGTPTIDSPNNLNINAVNVAISTDITVAGKVSLGTGTSISSPAANTLTLGTNSVERVRIDSNGNIGIGIDNPGTKLDVRGGNWSNGDIVVGETGNAGRINFRRGADGSDAAYLGYDGATNNSQVALAVNSGDGTILFKTNSTERLRVDSSGRMGLGTETPDSYIGDGDNFVIAESGSAGLTIATGTSDTGTINFADGTSGDARYRGRFEYNHSTDALDILTAATTHMRIHSGGVVSFNSGIELGSGIDGTAANTLDDYEEGTWTPTYESSGASFTYSGSTSGNYVKIGRMVFCRGTLRTNSVSGGSAGTSVLIGGLPFTVNNNSIATESGYGGVHVFIGASGTFNGEFPTSGQTVPNTTTAALYYRSTSDGNTIALTYADLKDGTNQSFIKFSLQYEV